MYGLKPVPFKLKPVSFKLMPVSFKLKPVPFKLKPVPFKVSRSVPIMVSDGAMGADGCSFMHTGLQFRTRP
jgi:hypothetical protein